MKKVPGMVTERLRSRKLALWLLLLLVLFSAAGSLMPAETARSYFGSPLFAALPALLCVNVFLCTWSRFSRRRTASTGRARSLAWLDLMMHCSIIVILLGGLIKSLWSFTGTQYLFVGTETDTVYDWRIKADGPLGFTVVLRERVDEYYPLQLKIGIREIASGEKAGLLELREGRPADLPGGNLQVEIMGFSRETGELTLKSRSGDEEKVLALSVRSDASTSADFGDFTITVVAFRQELKKVRGRLAILEDGREVKEEWLTVNSRVKHGKTSIYQTAWGRDEFGNPFIGIQVTRDPGALLFWIGSIVFTLALPLFLSLRAAGGAGKRGSGEVPPPSVRSRPPSRRKIYPIMTAFLVLLSIEGGARLMETLREWAAMRGSSFVDVENLVPVFEAAEVEGTKIYRRTGHHPLMLGNQSFLFSKPEEGLRIFVVGGSAAAGWPYEIGEFSLGSLLKRKLEMLYPDRTIEVVIAAGGTYGSHRVRFVFDEIIAYDPDLVLIYSGNNEFLEHFVFRPRKPPGPLRHFALARILHSAYLAAATPRPSFDVENYSLADQRANRISFAFGKASKYRQDPAQFKELTAHYRDNIDHMVRQCLAQDVAVMLLNVPVNLKDWIPNASRHREGIDLADLDAWQELFREGLLDIESGDFQGAAQAFQSAAAIDDEYAETHYHHGIALQRLGKVEAAKAAYLRALERDAFPFRALPQFQEILSGLAEHYRVPLVDLIGALEKTAEEGIIGLDVLIDYVHLSEKSQETAAHEILRAMRDSGMLPDIPAAAVEGTRISTESVFRPRIEVEALSDLYVQYLIMRQYDKLDAIYEACLDTYRRAREEEPGLEELIGNYAGIVGTLHAAVLPYREVLEAGKRGLLKEEFSPEEAERIYTDYVNLIKAMEAPDVSREEFMRNVPPLRY